MQTNYQTALREFRDKLTEEITQIVEKAPDKIVHFRIGPDDRDEDDPCDEDEVLYDLNIGEKDQDGCYPTVMHARIDVGRSVQVCCTNSWNDPEYFLSDLSTDDLVQLHAGLIALTSKTYAVKLYYHGCIELEVSASGEEEALLLARSQASSMPADEFIAESAITDEDHDITEVVRPEKDQ